MIDFHCHLDLYPDPEMAAKEAHDARVYVLSVTTTPRAWRKTSALAHDRPRIRTALGLHPQLAHERHHELALFEGLLPETRYVGEIGLDGSPDLQAHAEVQRRVFRTILKACARQGGRVLSIHSRRAADDVLACLGQEPDAGVPILHWFSGTPAQLGRAVRQGCWFSVGAPMLRSVRGRALVMAMPRNRVLIETDGPFGTDGRKPLKPENSWDALAALAYLWAIQPDEVRDLMRGNLASMGVTVEHGLGSQTVHQRPAAWQDGDQAH